MKVNRRKTLGILAAAVTATRTSPAQAPPSQPAAPTDALQSARASYQSDAQRIATVKLPQSTEPAFQFKA